MTTTSDIPENRGDGITIPHRHRAKHPTGQTSRWNDRIRVAARSEAHHNAGVEVAAWDS